MASCHKCGKPKIKKRRDGLRWCRRCGAMPGVTRVGRAGSTAVLNKPIGEQHG